MRISDRSSDVCSSALPLAPYTTAAIIVAALVVLAVAVAFGAFWWRLASAHNRTLAEQYRRLANRIQGQKQLLDSINGAIEEFIGMKAPDRTSPYANPAFAHAALGKPSCRARVCRAGEISGSAGSLKKKTTIYNMPKRI